MPGFGKVLAVLLWEETTFTQEMDVIRTAGLFAQRVGPDWTVASCVCLVWSYAASSYRSTVVTNRGAHNLGVVSCMYFVKQGGEGLRYVWFYRG